MMLTAVNGDPSRGPGQFLRHLTALGDAALDGWSTIVHFQAVRRITPRRAGTCYSERRYCTSGTRARHMLPDMLRDRSLLAVK